MNLLQRRLSIYLVLIAVLLLSSAVGAIGADVAEHHRSVWKNSGNASQAKEESSLFRIMAPRFFQYESQRHDGDEEGIWVTAISTRVMFAVLTLTTLVLLVSAIIKCYSIRSTPRNLQYRFIHTR